MSVGVNAVGSVIRALEPPGWKHIEARSGNFDHANSGTFAPGGGLCVKLRALHAK